MVIVPYAIGSIVFVIALSIAYWGDRVYENAHPMDNDPKDEPWLIWVLILIALAATEFPKTATVMCIALLAALASFSPMAASIMGMVLLVSLIWYWVANYLDSRRHRTMDA